ncbi:MAG: serine/threonine-protein phosphatase [Candidatus Latescibacteria bacterium]|jgi:serine phosphatase RsbU (regulator of sigma subunit)|nr:serine/threonine-protein phosphatase [Candidatus Latescibacterota bacterium]
MMKLLGRSNKVGHLSSPDRKTDQSVIHLDITQCFSDSLSVLTQHPILLVGASLLTVILSAASGLLLMGSLYAGLLIITLKAMDGTAPTLGNLFNHIKQFPSFFLVLVFCVTTILTGILLVLVPFTLLNWHTLLFDATIPLSDRITQLATQIQNVSWGFRLAFLSFAAGLCYFITPRIFAGVRCLYMLPLTTERNLPADETYVESKKAVQQHGFKQHVLLTLIMLWILAINLEAFAAAALSMPALIGLTGLFVFQQPFLIGLLASAYRQTLRVEAHQQEQHEEHVVEMQDELKTARDMQLSLLPSENPNLDGYELDDICIPANAVCGDYYTYRWLNERYFALIAADVSGKAMQAAVTAVRFNEMVRYECKNRIDPAEILDGLDASLEDQIGMMSFITCCVAVLDTHTNTVEIANAGHCEPCIFSHLTEQTEMISLPGFPLGLARSLRPQSGYEKYQTTLEPGDTLFLYSDGVVEARNKAGELYEDERLIKLLTRAGNRLNPKEIIDRVVQEVERHIGNAPPSDDISMIAFKRQKTPNLQTATK